MIVSIRRKAMQPFTFPDGTHIEKGQWACVPQRALMRDPARYPNGDTFIGTRYLSDQAKSSGGEMTRLTDLDHFFPFWGLGKRAW